MPVVLFSDGFNWRRFLDDYERQQPGGSDTDRLFDIARRGRIFMGLVGATSGSATPNPPAPPTQPLVVGAVPRVILRASNVGASVPNQPVWRSDP